jgi:hypothetical protein
LVFFDIFLIFVKNIAIKIKKELIILRKIKGEFLTEHDAESAIEKICAHCSNIRIFYNDMNPGYINYSSLPEDDYIGYPNTGHYSMMANWNLNPFNTFDSFNFEHTRSYNFLSSMAGKTRRTLLEADVSDDKFEYVKDKLYLHGAISVSS